MSTTRDLVDALKAELKAAGLTYGDVAAHLGLAESSVKRMFARDGDLPLSRVDELLGLLRIDFADLARRVADAQPQPQMLDEKQEAALVAEPKLLLVASCCLSQWTAEQMLSTYRLELAELVGLLAQLDRLGIIRLRPLNRYRLLVAKTFRWRPGGPVMRYFRAHVLDEFFDGDFGGDGERLTLLHGQLAPEQLAQLDERLARLAQDFAQQHLSAQRLPASARRPVTLLVASRSWWFSAFAALRR